MTHPFCRFLLAVSLCLPILLAFPGPVQAEESSSPKAEEQEKTDEERAIDFLRKLEEKNKETTSLQAEFDQLRVDSIFLDEVESSGRFWYQAPGKFRASYDSRHPSEIWIFEDHTINYIPSIEQVEIYPLPEGDNAPINQMLLGFGVETERILEVFDVKAIPAEDEEEFVIEFISRNLDRSLHFSRVVIHFDREKVEPRKLALEDDQSEITVTLRRVVPNADIDPARFEPSWPERAEVLDSR